MAALSYNNYSGIGQYGYNPAQASQSALGIGGWNSPMPQPIPLPGPYGSASASAAPSYASSLAGYNAPIGPTMPAGATGGGDTTPYIPPSQAVIQQVGDNDPLAAALYNAQQPSTLGGLFKNQDGSLNMDFIGQLLNGIGKFGTLALGFSANRQAKDALNFQKEAYRTNLANSTKSYNMALEDRAYARAAQYGDASSSADDYINKHRL